MGWIESHTVLNRHRKVRDLAFKLGIKPVYALGHLHSLWHTALEQQEDGNLRSWSDSFLADAADFEGDPGTFRKALEDIHWLDDGLIHDWLDYAGRFLRGKYAGSNIQRLKQIWAVHCRRYGKPTSNQHKTNRKPTTPTVPNHTLPTIPNQPTPKLTFSFESIWKDYPRKLGRDKALDHFKAQVKTPEDFQKIQIALKNYIAELQKKGTEEDYILHGSTWFNKRWRDWASYGGVELPRKSPAPLKPPPCSHEGMKGQPGTTSKCPLCSEEFYTPKPGEFMDALKGKAIPKGA